MFSVILLEHQLPLPHHRLLTSTLIVSEINILPNRLPLTLLFLVWPMQVPTLVSKYTSTWVYFLSEASEDVTCYIIPKCVVVKKHDVVWEIDGGIKATLRCQIGHCGAAGSDMTLTAYANVICGGPSDTSSLITAYQVKVICARRLIDWDVCASQSRVCFSSSPSAFAPFNSLYRWWKPAGTTLPPTTPLTHTHTYIHTYTCTDTH